MHLQNQFYCQIKSYSSMCAFYYIKVNVFEIKCNKILRQYDRAHYAVASSAKLSVKHMLTCPNLKF